MFEKHFVMNRNSTLTDRQTDRQKEAGLSSLLCFAFEMVALWGIFLFRNAVLNGLGKSLNDLKSLYSSRQIFSWGTVVLLIERM